MAKEIFLGSAKGTSWMSVCVKLFRKSVVF